MLGRRRRDALSVRPELQAIVRAPGRRCRRRTRAPGTDADRDAVPGIPDAQSGLRLEGRYYGPPVATLEASYAEALILVPDRQGAALRRAGVAAVTDASKSVAAAALPGVRSVELLGDLAGGWAGVAPRTGRRAPLGSVGSVGWCGMLLHIGSVSSSFWSRIESRSRHNCGILFV